MTHFDFGGSEAGTAVHSLESDGVELSLVQVDHGQLTGLVRGSRGSSQGKLEVVPESLWRGAGVGAGVDGAVLFLREGIAVGKSLTSTQGNVLIKGKKDRPKKTRLAAQEIALSFHIMTHRLTSLLGSLKTAGSGHFCSRESKMMLSSCLS